MASPETETFECDPQPMSTFEGQAGEKEHEDATMAEPEPEAFEPASDATRAALGFVDSDAIGSAKDGSLLTQKDHLELDPNAMSAVDSVAKQAGVSEHANLTTVLGESEVLGGNCHATVSVSSVALDGSMRNDKITVPAKLKGFEHNPRAVSVQGVSDHDGTGMEVVETGDSRSISYIGAKVDFGVSVEEATTSVSIETQYVPQNDDDFVAPIQHREQEVAASTDVASNHEESFSLARPDGETGGKRAFEDGAIDNQEENQGEEHVFDISEFDLGPHDVPMTETLFGEECMFPSLDTGKADAWHRPEHDVILEDRSYRHDRDQKGDRYNISTGTSSDANVFQDAEAKLDVEEKLADDVPPQMGSDTVMVEPVQRLNEADSEVTDALAPVSVEGILDSDVPNPEKGADDQCIKADCEVRDALAPGIVEGITPPSEDLEGPDTQEGHLQGDANDVLFSIPEENVQIVQPQFRSSEDRLDVDNIGNEAENQGNMLNTIDEDAAVHSPNFDQDMSPGMGLKNTNPNIATKDEELHLATQDASVGSRTETFKSSTMQASGDEENEYADRQSNEICAVEQSREFKEDASQNKGDGKSIEETACMDISAGSVSVLVKRKQGETVAVLNSETSMEAVVCVAESIVQGERNVPDGEVIPNSMQLEVGPMISTMEIDESHDDKVEKRSDDQPFVDVKSVEKSVGSNLERREIEGAEAVKEGGDSLENKVGAQVHEDEQEELCLKPPVETALPDSLAEEPKQQGLAQEATAISSDLKMPVNSCSDVAPVNDSPESLNVHEKSPSQTLEPGEESSGNKSMGSSDSVPKKRVKKHSGDHKMSMPKGGNKLGSSTLKGRDGYKDGTDGELASEPDNDRSESKLCKPHKEENTFGVGDLVWAKVRSHPWWPAQIFDPADASKSARKAKKFGRVLVAFFGDCTFAWLQQSQMIAFRPNFKEKVSQTTVRIFCLAVEEALEEICRRSELSLSCEHIKGSLHSSSLFPEANSGLREGARVKWQRDISSGVDLFRPDKTLEYVKGVACSPLGLWCSTLKQAEMRGHVYGLRTCLVAAGSFDSATFLSAIRTTQKRTHSSLETNGNADAGSGKKGAKKMKRAFDGGGFSQVSKKLKKVIEGGQGSDAESKPVARKKVSGIEGNNDGHKIRFKLSKRSGGDSFSSSEGLPGTASGRVVGSKISFDDGREMLAESPVKTKKRASSKQERNSSSSKKKMCRKSGGESQDHASRERADSEAATSPRAEADAEDALVVTSSLSEDKVRKAEVKRGGKDKKKLVQVARSPVSSIDAEDVQEETQITKPNVASRDGAKKIKSPMTLKEAEMKTEVVTNELDAGAKRKFSKVGDSIMKVAGALTAPKSADDSPAKRTGPGLMIRMKDSGLKAQASPSLTKKATSKGTAKDSSLLQLRQDLELLASKTGGGSRKSVKYSKRGEQGEAAPGKISLQRQSMSHKTQKSGVQELALAARKRKSEMVYEEVQAKVPKNSSTSGLQGHHHASKAYNKDAEKPVEHSTFDKTLSHYSRRPAVPASTVKGSSSHDEKLSSHTPLGLFMRFPEDFPLPSESQLKASFIPFGPLQMSATRLYHDSTSAQVVFKHGRDAESAMKHAKKNALFGPVAVTYRLRHLLHSTKAESKTDVPSPPTKGNSSTPVRVTKEKVVGDSASLENNAEDKELATSGVVKNASDAGSEPTGDIQDQMMTLLRQVSVLVKPSPAGPDGT